MVAQRESPAPHALPGRVPPVCRGVCAGGRGRAGAADGRGGGQQPGHQGDAGELLHAGGGRLAVGRPLSQSAREAHRDREEAPIPAACRPRQAGAHLPVPRQARGAPEPRGEPGGAGRGGTLLCAVRRGAASAAAQRAHGESAGRAAGAADGDAAVRELPGSAVRDAALAGGALPLGALPSERRLLWRHHPDGAAPVQCAGARHPRTGGRLHVPADALQLRREERQHHAHEGADHERGGQAGESAARRPQPAQEPGHHRFVHAEHGGRQPAGEERPGAAGGRAHRQAGDDSARQPQDQAVPRRPADDGGPDLSRGAQLHEHARSARHLAGQPVRRAQEGGQLRRGRLRHAAHRRAGRRVPLPAGARSGQWHARRLQRLRGRHAQRHRGESRGHHQQPGGGGCVRGHSILAPRPGQAAAPRHRAAARRRALRERLRAVQDPAAHLRGKPRLRRAAGGARAHQPAVRARAGEERSAESHAGHLLPCGLLRRALRGAGRQGVHLQGAEDHATQRDRAAAAHHLHQALRQGDHAQERAEQRGGAGARRGGGARVGGHSLL
mmetsp:Transcript_40849/g.102844  ORF Transcript_40849/g.102844 Transcript_40849/m.102844 type:complete len:556 (-) Transcript_40849:687-2354(-)